MSKKAPPCLRAHALASVVFPAPAGPMKNMSFRMSNLRIKFPFKGICTNIVTYGVQIT